MVIKLPIQWRINFAYVNLLSTVQSSAIHGKVSFSRSQHTLFNTCANVLQKGTPYFFVWLCICEQKLDKYYIEHPIRNNLQVMCNMEKEIATHSSILAWRIPGTEEPGELLSMGSHSQTRLKRCSSSSSLHMVLFFFASFLFYELSFPQYFSI